MLYNVVYFIKLQYGDKVKNIVFAGNLTNKYTWDEISN